MRVGDRVLWYGAEWEIKRVISEDTIEIFPIEQEGIVSYFSYNRPAWAHLKRVTLITDLVRELL